jgi:PAS domain S-box-containing protein
MAEPERDSCESSHDPEVARQQFQHDLFELLRFEQLLSELSARLVRSTTDQITAAIHGALEQIVGFFRVDRGALYDVVDADLIASHTYAVPGVTPVLHVDTANLPWLRAAMVRGEICGFATLDTLPEEARKDREALAAVDVKSLMAIPLAVGGAVRHVFALAAVRQPRTWDPMLAPRIRLVGELLADTLARQKAEEAREERLRFERLLADVSARFVSVSSEQVDAEIHGALHRILEFFGLDRSCFLRSTPAGVVAAHPSHLVGRSNPLAPPELDRRRLYPWLIGRAMRGEAFVVGRNELPESASVDRESFEQYAIRAALVIPIVVRGTPQYLLGGETTNRDARWREETIVRLRLLGEIFAGALTRRSNEEERREAELKYRTVADSAYDWTYWVEIGGAFRYITPSCQRITGYTAQEFETRPSLLRDLVAPEDLPLWDEHHRQCHEAQKTGELQYRIHAKDGHVVWLDHLCRPVFDEQGRCVGIRASNHDATKRKQAEAESRRLHNELAHVSRVTALGELAAALAHEINQPLTAILNNAQAAQRLLSVECPDLDEVREALGDIVEDDRRAGQVIRRLRALLKREEPERQTLDINALIEEIVALIRGEFVIRDVQLRLEPAGHLPKVRGDRVQIQQVLLNLLRNAGEAMVDLPRALRTVWIRTWHYGSDAVGVSVSDAGPPIDENTLAKMFDPFYTTKSEGLGIGLPISRSIIEAHGGRIWVERNAGAGLTIHFTLPCAPETPPNP